MDEQAFQLLFKQLEKLEEKVDELVRWKYYFTGVAAVVGAVFGGSVSILIAWVTGKN